MLLLKNKREESLEKKIIKRGGGKEMIGIEILKLLRETASYTLKFTFGRIKNDKEIKNAVKNYVDYVKLMQREVRGNG